MFPKRLAARRDERGDAEERGREHQEIDDERDRPRRETAVHDRLGARGPVEELAHGHLDRAVMRGAAGAQVGADDSGETRRLLHDRRAHRGARRDVLHDTVDLRAREHVVDELPRDRVGERRREDPVDRALELRAGERRGRRALDAGDRNGARGGAAAREALARELDDRARRPHVGERAHRHRDDASGRAPGAEADDGDPDGDVAALHALCSFFELRAARISDALSLASVYASPTSCLPPVHPNTITTRTVAKTTFQAVTISCCAVE